MGFDIVDSCSVHITLFLFLFFGSLGFVEILIETLLLLRLPSNLFYCSTCFSSLAWLAQSYWFLSSSCHFLYSGCFSFSLGSLLQLVLLSLSFQIALFEKTSSDAFRFEDYIPTTFHPDIYV